MKKITLSLCSLAISFLAISQQNPCPDIQSSGFNPVSGTFPCSANVYAFATGDIASNKSINIKVYAGNTATGTPIKDECFLVPGGSTTTKYQTTDFNFACGSTVTYVIASSTNSQCGGSTCGTTITVEGANPLPISLTNFFASRSTGAVTLSWKTESEINAKEFVIQRNTGAGFVDIATVAARNIITGSSYSFVDKNNSSKVVSQYRLKMNDIDGAFKNSDIKVVKASGVAADFSIYPNPSNGVAKVSISDISGPTDVQLIDNTGRILKNILLTNTNTVDYNSLQKGMYMIRIINKTTGETLTKKLNVVN